MWYRYRGSSVYSTYELIGPTYTTQCAICSTGMYSDMLDEGRGNDEQTVCVGSRDNGCGGGDDDDDEAESGN